MIIGIDTGISGGMSLYAEGILLECCEVPNYWHTMVSKTRAGKPKRRRRIDYPELTNVLGKWGEMGATDIVIEKVHAMPRDSGASAFSFGEAWGTFNAMSSCYGFNVLHVTPQAWKKHYQLIGTDKKASMALAQEMFGNEWFTKQADHNKAESALIAAYGVTLIEG